MRRFDPYRTARRQEIPIIYKLLPWPFRGIFSRVMGMSFIVLVKGMTPIEERCVLAEEVGHHVLTVGNCVGPFYSTADQLIANREERRVMRWVATKMISDREFRRLVKRGLSVEELAEHFEVTPRLVLAKAEFIAAGRSHHGDGVLP